MLPRKGVRYKTYNLLSESLFVIYVWYRFIRETFTIQ